MRRIQIFSHTDLDGVAPVILLKHFFPEAEIHYTLCTPKTILNETQKFLDEKVYEEYDYIYFTDISVNEELAKELDKIKGKVVRLFDHHPTAFNLNKFNFCTVEAERNDELICGTKLFYQYLIEEFNLKANEATKLFVKYVNDYDTWLWEDKYHYDTPNEWNVLFNFYGKVNFIEETLKKLNVNNLSYNELDEIILRVEAAKKRSYVLGKMKDVYIREINGYKTAIVFGEQYINDLCQKLYEVHPESQIQMVVGTQAVSYRVRGNEDIDLSEFVKQFGGGGHPKAAGSPIERVHKNKFLNNLFGR